MNGNLFDAFEHIFFCETLDISLNLKNQYRLIFERFGHFISFMLAFMNVEHLISEMNFYFQTIFNQVINGGFSYFMVLRQFSH